ncbi:MAG: epoxyqueuosine reductase QueH [Lachnospiraceae bacterium]|jgi:predicted adenine nucleotide alpha hydrolase (AANH) superfamily ATPase
MGKENYQICLDKIINAIQDEGKRPSLLLHSCCGPCSGYVLSYLREYFDITVFYYNPNIYPGNEYDIRRLEQLRLISELNNEAPDKPVMFYEAEYDHNEFLSFVTGFEKEPEGGSRCRKCFELRLEKTAQIACRLNADYFGTALTVAPHKNSQVINSIGKSIEQNLREENKKQTALWLPSDFKKREGYKKSIELSEKYGLYRQNYCGCEFSIR